MSHSDDPSDQHDRTDREGPSVVYLRMPRLSRLPPDAWFEDAEGDEAMIRAEQDRLQRLEARRSGC